MNVSGPSLSVSVSVLDDTGGKSSEAGSLDFVAGLLARPPLTDDVAWYDDEGGENARRVDEATLLGRFG